MNSPKPKPIRQSDPNQTAKSVLDQALSKVEQKPKRKKKQTGKRR